MAVSEDIRLQLKALQANLSQPVAMEGSQIPSDPTQVPAVATTEQDTRTQLQELQRNLAAGQPVQQAGVAPTTFLEDVGTAISNIPGSALGVAEGFANILLSPIETATTLAGIGEGALDVVLGEETEEAQLAREAFKQATRLLRDPGGTLVNDPVGALLDVAGIAGGVGLVGKAAGLSRFARGAAAVERATNPINLIPRKPINVVVKATGAAARPVAKKLKETAIARLAVTTGAGQGAIRQLLEAGKAGGKRAEIAKETLANPDLQKVALETVDAVEEAKGLRSLRFEEDLAKLELKNPNSPVDPQKVRTEIFKDLEETWGVRVTPTMTGGQPELVMTTSNPIFAATGEQARLKAFVKVMEQWGNDPSFMNAWRVEQALDGLIDKGINRDAFRRSNRILIDARKKIRSELGEKVKGFDEMQGDYAAATGAINQITKSLGIKASEIGDDVGFLTATLPTKIDEAVLTKLGNLLNDRGAKNLGIRRRAVEVLDEVILEKRLRDQGLRVDDSFQALREMGNDTPQARLQALNDLADQNGIQRTSLLDELAAVRLGDEAQIGIARAQSPTGLIGGALGAAGGSFAGGVGAGIGGAAGVALQRLLSNMTIRNPRAVGRFFLGLGAAESKALQMQKLFQQVADNTPAQLVEQGITFVAALERMGDRVKEKRAAERVLGPIGF